VSTAPAAASDPCCSPAPRCETKRASVLRRTFDLMWREAMVELVDALEGPRAEPHSPTGAHPSGPGRAWACWAVGPGACARGPSVLAPTLSLLCPDLFWCDTHPSQVPCSRPGCPSPGARTSTCWTRPARPAHCLCSARGGPPGCRTCPAGRPRTCATCRPCGSWPMRTTRWCSRRSAPTCAPRWRPPWRAWWSCGHYLARADLAVALFKRILCKSGWCCSCLAAWRH